MSFPPPRPMDVAPDQTVEGEVSLRYEDIAEDGRIQLTSLPHTFGTLLWSGPFRNHPIQGLAREEGILPILTKLAIEGGDEPFAVGPPLWGRGAYDLAHAGEGAQRRLILNIWIDFEGARGVTHGPPPPGAGERVPAGRVYGEHVFTRPFAPSGKRRVTHFDAAGLPEIPPRPHVYLRPETLLEIPEGAAPIEDALAPDPAPITLGLAHTDSNRHVNSLVYPRLFEEALLRRAAERGFSPARLLMRRVELAYRRPSFAGDRLAIYLRLYERGGRLGAVGALVAVDGASGAEPGPGPAEDAVRTYARAELA